MNCKIRQADCDHDTKIEDETGLVIHFTFYMSKYFLYLLSLNAHQANMNISSNHQWLNTICASLYSPRTIISKST